MRRRRAFPMRFASAARRSPRQIRKEAATVATSDLVREALDRSPDAVTVLNAERQIVLCNRGLLRVAGKKNAAKALGQRPGEILNCIHAFETEGGCGTTQFCEVCGALQSILASQRGLPNAKECRITRDVNGRLQALDLLVSSSPAPVGGQFIIFGIIDISHEKRRRVLEHVFLHDVLNTAAAVESLVDQLPGAALPGEATESVDLLRRTARRLLSQIQSQRELAAAEDGSLQIHVSRFRSLGLMREIVDDFVNLPVAMDRTVEIDPGSEDVRLISDPVLLRRVIENLVRNGLEASKSRAKVTVGCHLRGRKLEFCVHNPETMSEDVQLQIFQRSFSTKGSGRGLGTYSVKLLTERYLKGSVRFESAEPEGTTFIVSCPTVLRLRPQKPRIMGTAAPDLRCF